MRAADFLTDYLGKPDLEKPILVTIRGTEGREIEGKRKLVIWFEEVARAWIANKTAIRTIRELYGDDLAGWRGKPLVLFVDPQVEFGGRQVGGVRCRAPRDRSPSPQPQSEPNAAPPRPRHEPRAPMHRGVPPDESPGGEPVDGDELPF
ncbi:MAG: hypothetical protein JXA57_02315 [Armatimonadetes bacterium]|nr:hypothetical protein [Armatimonadota bacterium]